MVSTKIIARKDKKNSNNEVPLFIRLTAKRKSNYISLGININIDYWDDKAMQVKRGHPNMARINNFLTTQLADLQSKAIESETKIKNDTTTVKKLLKGNEKVDFLKFFKESNDKLLAKDKINSHRRANSVYIKIKDYVGDNILYFEDINVKWLTDYEFYLTTTKKNAPNTVYTEMKAIRKIINLAINEDAITMVKSPFSKYKLKWEQVDKNYLTEGELLALDTLILPSGSCMQVHRDIYIFAAYTGGLRISDIFQLRWRDIDGEKVSLKTQKTGSVVSIKLPNKSKEILAKYKSYGASHNSYVFPILSKYENLDNETERLRVISAANSYVNKDLTKLAKLACIDKHIHFHTSRHTFATRALRKGMRIEYVSKLLGHSNIKTTQIYTKIVNEELDKAMDVFND
ncbi:MAG: site-specific integrase [Bacteroidetes bacterium]|nr:site-specific integrase [Bacteroidota bacterium]